MLHVGLLFDIKTITGTFLQWHHQVQWHHRSWNALDQTPACPVSAMVPPIALLAIVGRCAPCASTIIFETMLVSVFLVPTMPSKPWKI
jgi:hypothetical protein